MIHDIKRLETQFLMASSYNMNYERLFAVVNQTHDAAMASAADTAVILTIAHLWTLDEDSNAIVGEPSACGLTFGPEHATFNRDPNVRKAIKHCPSCAEWLEGSKARMRASAADTDPLTNPNDMEA